MIHITVPYGEKNVKIFRWIHLVIFTFILAQMFMPDIDFDGNVYAVCNLIENPPMIIGCYLITMTFLIVHVIFLIHMLVARMKEK